MPTDTTTEEFERSLATIRRLSWLREAQKFWRMEYTVYCDMQSLGMLNAFLRAESEVEVIPEPDRTIWKAVHLSPGSIPPGPSIEERRAQFNKSVRRDNPDSQVNLITEGPVYCAG